jgi:hypothetical protein
MENSLNAITKDMILEYSSRNAKTTRGVLLSSGRYFNAPTRSGDETVSSTTSQTEDDWESGVEVLQLSHMKLTSLRGIEGLLNLRKASFIDNEIEKI